MGTSTSILCISHHPADMLKQQFEIDLNAPHIDQFILTSETTIGIDLVRDIIKFAQHPPMQHDQKHIVIMNAETLTLEAQNALLKLLEEPPTHTQILLCAPHTQSFLDTILSRCSILRDVTSEKIDAHEPLLQPLLQCAPPARLILIPSDAKTADGAVLYCRNLIHEAEMLLQTQPTQSNVRNLSILTACLTHLSANANPTLCLTDAILQLK